MFDPEIIALIRRDAARRLKKYPGAGKLWLARYYRENPQYLTLLFHRLSAAARPAPLRAIFSSLYRRSSRRTGLEILTPRLGGGVIMPHWGRMLLNARSIGDDLYLFHNVTVGNDYRTGTPSIGNGVFLGAGATILGGIEIGDHVLVGAGSVVLHDIPSNSVVAGNPAKVLRETRPGEISSLIGY